MPVTIKNAHTATLSVGKKDIPAGKVATYTDAEWAVIGNNRTVKTWLTAKVLIKGGTPDADPVPGLPGAAPVPGLPGANPVPAGEDAELAEKTVLIAELKKLTGNERTVKSSLESLRKQVAEAKGK